MGGVKVPQVPRGWVFAVFYVRYQRGIPLPTGGRVWCGGTAPSPENCSYLLSKIPYFDAF